jgi:hypothetical protein
MNSMGSRVRILLVIVCVLSSAVGEPVSAAGGTPAADAKAVLNEAAEALGGIEKLKSIETVHIDGIGHTNLLEQSERPEGPWAVTYQQVNEDRDLQHGRLRQAIQSRSPAIGIADWSASKWIAADGVAANENKGQFYPGSPSQIQEAEETLAFAPERVITTALEAQELRLEHDVLLQGTNNHVVAFTWKGGPARLFLNHDTRMPTAVEYTRPMPYDVFWSVWGEVITRIYFSNWDLKENGLRYPLQLDMVRNGQPLRTLSIAEVKFNASLPPDTFNIPAEVQTAFKARKPITINELPLGAPGKSPVTIAKDIIQIQGRWNIAVVRQTDGIVVLESPISSGYSARLMAEVQKQFPGIPIKCVISTSDAWPHIGGMREYVARGIPVYLLDLNRPIAQRLISAPFRSNQDSLAQGPRKAVMKVVAGKTVIGTGDERLEIYPVRGEVAERMMVVYSPGTQTLYASDIIQKYQGKFFNLEALSEVAGLVQREKLDVKTVFAMHTGAIPYAEIVEATMGKK